MLCPTMFGIHSGSIRGSVRAPFGPISDQNFQSHKFKISKNCDAPRGEARQRGGSCSKVWGSRGHPECSRNDHVTQKLWFWIPKFSQDASKFSPSPPKIDPKAIQKASWSPSWPIVLKRYDLERPTSSQNAPKSAPKTLQSAPNPSQMEPKTLPNQIFEQFFALVFFWS